MFFILSKTLYYISMPLVWISVLLLAAVISRNQQKRKKMLGGAFILVIFFSNNFIANEMMLLWEKEPSSIESLPVYETGIVLTGITNTYKQSEDRVFFQKGADRLLHAVQLYKLGKIKTILISGGSGTIVGTASQPEADQLKSVFLYCGVAEKDIIIENKSRNTRENALFTKHTMDSLDVKGKYLLITSAFHMRRAEGCFQKAGLHPDTFPVDFYTINRRFTPDHILIPAESALFKWSVLIHEMVGYMVYKLLGYC